MLQNSTQYKRWCFANREAEFQKLKDIKETKYKKAYQKVLKNDPQANIGTVGLEDEIKLLNFYIQQYIAVCSNDDDPLPLRVEAAAITYFKRFFLKDILVNPDDPERYFHCCLYMAFKSEEIHMDFRTLARTLRDKYYDSTYTNTFNSRLDFDLKLHSPYLPLESLLEKLKDVPGVYERKQECINILKTTYYDLTMFEYPHGMLSLGAFLYIMNKHNINILSNAEFNQLVVIPEESKPALDKILEKLKQNDGRRIPTEDAKLSKKKLKALYHVSTHKDDFVKPPEKHVHVNPSNESTNAAEKPSNN